MPVLLERRNRAEAYMRRMATVLWRATEDLVWTKKSGISAPEEWGEPPLVVRAGRLYRGIPYSFAGLPAANFYQYFGDKDQKGFPTVSGLTWKHLNGSSVLGVARVGNDCSGSIQLAWDYIGANILFASTAEMTRTNGYLPVGAYEADTIKHTDTVADCEKNGLQTMFAAYAQLQKADGVVNRQNGAGHTMMVTGLQVVRNEDGTIDGEKSYITMLHQVSKYLREEAYIYDEALGENVYKTYGVEDVFTFKQLFDEGYLPITCDVLTDPNAQKEIWRRDTEEASGIETIFKGQFVSSRPIAFVTVTVKDQTGLKIMEQRCFNYRQAEQFPFAFDLSRFETEPAFLMQGNLNLKELAPGTYHCTHVLTDAHGGEHTMRDFDFTVE